MVPPEGRWRGMIGASEGIVFRLRGVFSLLKYNLQYINKYINRNQKGLLPGDSSRGKEAPRRFRNEGGRCGWR